MQWSTYRRLSSRLENLTLSSFPLKCLQVCGLCPLLSILHLCFSHLNNESIKFWSGIGPTVKLSNQKGLLVFSIRLKSSTCRNTAWKTLCQSDFGTAQTVLIYIMF